MPAIQSTCGWVIFRWNKVDIDIMDLCITSIIHPTGLYMVYIYPNSFTFKITWNNGKMTCPWCHAKQIKPKTLWLQSEFFNHPTVKICILSLHKYLSWFSWLVLSPINLQFCISVTHQNWRQNLIELNFTFHSSGVNKINTS